MQTQKQTPDATELIPAVLRHFVTQQVTDVELQPDWTVDFATIESTISVPYPRPIP